MQINNVRRGDAGTYMCTASNNVGTMSADEIDLRILCKSFFFMVCRYTGMQVCKYAGIQVM